MGPIPAKYFWPGFCVALLALSVASGIATVVASQSDGGAQVVASGWADPAEQKARRAQQRENRRLDWRVDVRIPNRIDYEARTTVTIDVRDRSGAPLPGLEGRVKLHSPAKAGPLAASPLRDVDGEAGAYRATLPIGRPGLWDFVVELQSDDSDYVARIRREI